MGQKDTNDKSTATGGTGTPVAAARLTPIDVQQKEFQVSRFGGYKMRDVDEFLDQITDSFTAMTAEIERLSAGGTSRVVGAPDLDDVARQADEIIARARAEAGRIMGEARSVSSSPAPAGPQDREAVNAFISREREFLQSLAGLVQEHAETVKTMARSTRPTTPRANTDSPPATSMPPASMAPASMASASTTPASTTASSTPPAPSPAAPRTDTRSAPEPTAETPAPEPSPPPQPPTPAEAQPDRAAMGAAPARPAEPATSAEQPTRVPDPEPTVRLDEPAPAGASRRETEPEGDRSLRELFWGED